MPRHARQLSKTGIYHIMLRGINKQSIFENSIDKGRLCELLGRYKVISNFELYGYCLMDNHIHLLIKEYTEPISLIVKRISGSYVYWFNSKYERSGNLLQDRFKSEAVESDTYFLTVLRYIHQNPVKAGMTKQVSDYSWSSIHEYIKKQAIIDIDFALNMFSSNREKSIVLFEEFTIKHNNDHCLENKEKVRVTDCEIRTMLSEQGLSNVNQLVQLEKQKRDKIIKSIKSAEGVTIRQLSRITGISKSMIDRM